MTEKIEKMQVERKIYVAFDGREFGTKWGCLSYERECAERDARNIADKLPYFGYSPDWIDSEYNWDWYFVSSAEELNAVLKVTFNDEADVYEFAPPTFPCWVACSVDDDGYGYVVGTLEQVFDSLDKIKIDLIEKVNEIGGGCR